MKAQSLAPSSSSSSPGLADLGSLYLLTMGAVAIVVMLWAPKGFGGWSRSASVGRFCRCSVIWRLKKKREENISPIIDIYCHILPHRFFEEMPKWRPTSSNIGTRLRSITKLFDLDARFKDMDEFGDYRQIISLPNPAIEDIATRR